MKLRDEVIGLALAVALASCAETADEGAALKYDEQGRRLVEFKVPTKAYGAVGGIRALSDDTAQATWDFAQVVFDYVGDNGTFGDEDDEYFAGATYRGADVFLALPEGKYRALMFLGTAKELQLLGVGVVSATLNGSGTVVGEQPTDTDAEFTVEQNTKTIVFTVSALNATLYDDTSDPDVNTGSFKITSPDKYKTESFKADVNYQVNGVQVHPFVIPNNCTTEGEFTIKGFPMAITPAASENIEINTWLGVKNSQISITMADTPDAPSWIDGAVSTVSLRPDVDGKGAVTAAFNLTPHEEPYIPQGYVKLRFKFVAQAFGNTPAGKGGKGLEWSIANGLDSTEIDTSAGENRYSSGQNILILIETPTP
jgi:hypothetical protein